MPTTVGEILDSIPAIQTKNGPKPISPLPPLHRGAAALKLLKYNRIFDFAPASRRQIPRQTERTVAYSSQAIHLGANRLEKPAHLPVPSFSEHDSVAPVAAGALPRFFLAYGNESGDAILEMDAAAKLFKDFRGEAS